MDLGSIQFEKVRRALIALVCVRNLVSLSMQGWHTSMLDELLGN